MYGQDGLRAERTRNTEIELSKIRFAAKHSREGSDNSFTGRIRLPARAEWNSKLQNARLSDRSDDFPKIRIREPEIDGFSSPIIKEQGYATVRNLYRMRHHPEPVRASLGLFGVVKRTFREKRLGNFGR